MMKGLADRGTGSTQGRCGWVQICGGHAVTEAPVVARVAGRRHHASWRARSSPIRRVPGTAVAYASMGHGSTSLARCLRRGAKARREGASHDGARDPDDLRRTPRSTAAASLVSAQEWPLLRRHRSLRPASPGTLRRARPSPRSRRAVRQRSEAGTAWTTCVRVAVSKWRNSSQTEGRPRAAKQLWTALTRSATHHQCQGRSCHPVASHIVCGLPRTGRKWCAVFHAPAASVRDQIEQL